MASRGSSLTWPHRASWARLSCTEYGFDSLGNRWLWCPWPSRMNGLRWLTWAHWLCTQRRGFNLRASRWSDRWLFLRGCAWPCSWTFRRSTVRNGRTGPNPTHKFRWLSCRKCRQSEWNESFSKIKKREVRVFWSELKWGGNGGERKRNCRSKKSFFFFPGK